MVLMGHADGRAKPYPSSPVPLGRSVMEVGAVREQLDLRVHDRVALDEIDLYAEVLSAVAVSERALTAAELDEVLGLHPATRAAVGSS